jgi:S-DNA-T family DNA segregation ATPase FtsK/SpoIIIE
MESRGIISGYDGSKARSVLIDESELPRVLASLHGAEAPVTVAEGSASPADSADA